MSPVTDLTSGRPQVEPLSETPGGRPAPSRTDLVREREVRELAALLAHVVQLARSAAIFPGHWDTIAEQAMEHESVRAAVRAERSTGLAPLVADPPPMGDSLRDLIGDGRARC